MAYIHKGKNYMIDKTSHLALGLVAVFASATLSAEEFNDLAAGHPRPSYENVRDISAMAEAVRKSQFAAQRGAWE